MYMYTCVYICIHETMSLSSYMGCNNTIPPRKIRRSTCRWYGAARANALISTVAKAPTKLICGDVIVV